MNMKRLTFSLLGAAAMIAMASGAAHAQASFSVDPLIIDLDADTRSAVLSITNPTAKEIRFEIKAFAWDQAPPAGEMQLTPTPEVVIFPPLLTIKPKMTQRVRVGTTAAQGPIEKSYRLLVEELPTGDAPVVANQVAVRTRIGIPVFVAPTKATRSGDIGAIAIKNRTVSVTLRNTGTTHAMVDDVVIRGMSGPDEMVFEQSIQGWYVLAGKTRTWEYTFRPTQCPASKFIEVEVYAHDKVLKSQANMPAGACTAP